MLGEQKNNNNKIISYHYLCLFPLKWCFSMFQIPYNTMTPLQAAVGVRQVGSYNLV
jgi:hypothetical protein